MNEIAELLTMPREWERRPEAWQRLTQGFDLFNALCECVQNDDLEQAVALVSQWHVFVPNSSEQTRRSWEILCVLLKCAKIAALNPDTARNLPTLLHELDPHIQAPDELICQAASHDAQTWNHLLRDSLTELTWQAPSSAEWAWDAVTTLMGNPRPVAYTESIGVLLVIESGVTARLTLDRLADEGCGVLYPDPRTMSFVNWGEQFDQAMQSAIACTRAEGLSSDVERVDVRWRLLRQDGKQLTHIDGGSAGGAFALGLAKLFTDA